MQLKPRLLALTGLVILLTAVVASAAFYVVAEGLVERWGARLAEKQVLYDKARTLQPLLREIALARQLAESRAVKSWARAADDAELARKATLEMETYRGNFRDQNYFVALADSGRYYFNNAQNEFAGKQYRYTLSPRNADDGWFYALIRGGRDVHINVNPDTKLNVVKLWIDVLMRDGHRVLGVVGTGLDLRRFIEEVVNVPQPGITSIFVDRNAAIQLYRDPTLIDYASIVKTSQERKSLDLLLDRPEDRVAMRQVMAELERGAPRVVSRFVVAQGKRYLAGVAYLPEIGWHEITLMDLDVVVPLKDFAGLMIAFVITLLLALGLFNYAINRLILCPLSDLDEAMNKVQAGELPVPSSHPESGEIGRLMGHFRRMALAVAEERARLENAVALRTDALERQAKLDPLTELLNRRGMQAQIQREISRAARHGDAFGILWLDIDNFKQVNDQHGHASGDRALVAVADMLRANLRPYDSAARWGGDEFIVLLAQTDAEGLRVLAERVRGEVEAHCGIKVGAGDTLRLTVSVGAYLCPPGEGMESVLQKADKALYAAKEGGRNRVCVQPA
jgi:diguanylate cyclase (GGDEF)-like protein